MNSFRFIERGIRAEVARQAKIIEGGGAVIQETLHFDPASGAITSLRSKEEAHDYRYFPEPDLVPVAIDEQMLEAARADMSELPAERSARLEREAGLTADSAQLLAFRGELGDYFEAALAAGAEPAPPPQQLANWLTTELLGRLGEVDDPAAVARHARCARRRSSGSSRPSRSASARDGPGARAPRRRGRRAAGDRRREGLAAMDGGDELAAIVAAALAANPDAAQRVRDGNAKAIGPIVGHVMRETKGRADGTEVSRLVNEQLAG